MIKVIIGEFSENRFDPQDYKRREHCVYFKQTHKNVSIWFYTLEGARSHEAMREVAGNFYGYCGVKLVYGY